MTSSLCLAVCSLLPVQVRRADKQDPLFATEQEIDLIVGLEQRTLTGEEIVELLGNSKDESHHLLANAYKRDIINRVLEGDQVRYMPSRFKG